MLLEVGPKFEILRGNSILADLGQESERDERTEEAQTTGHEKGVLATANTIRTAGRIGLDDGEDVGAYEGADLPEGGRDGVILAPDRGGGGLGRDQADIIAGPRFAEGEEDAVDDHEAGDVRGGVEQAVAACHDEADDALQKDEDDERVFRTDHVADEGPADGSREVEDVYYGVPAEGFPDGRGVAQDDGDPG